MNTKTEISTKIVAPLDPVAPNPPFYQAGPKEYVKITLCLTTAGPCAIGTQTNLGAIGSTNGQLLPVNRERSFILSPGTIVYAASVGVQRVDFTAEPIPYLLAILMMVEKVVFGVGAFVTKFLPAPQVKRSITPGVHE